jgi:hypothetical protein
MSGANGLTGVGIYYLADPSGKGREGPMVYRTHIAYQVLVPIPENGMLQVVAECLCEIDAMAVLSRYIVPTNG